MRSDQRKVLRSTETIWVMRLFETSGLSGLLILESATGVLTGVLGRTKVSRRKLIIFVPKSGVFRA